MDVSRFEPALIELEEASHKKADKKGAKDESTKTSAKHAAKASAKATSALGRARRFN